MATTPTGIRRPDPEAAATALPGDEPPAPGLLTFRAYLWSSRAMVVGIATAVFAIFLPALVIRYAFSDDYPILFIAEGLGSSPWFGDNVIDTVAASGRPLAGVLDDLAFSAAGTIDNLRFVRLVGVVGIVGLALLLHWALVRAGIRSFVAALVAVLICTMPAFQVFGSWAVLFNVPYAAILGGAASLLVVAAVDAPRGVLDRLVAASAVLLGALLIYQSAAMFFWIFLAIALVDTARDSRRTMRMAGAHAGVAIVSVGLAYLVAKLAVRLVGTAPNPSRNDLTHDVVGKAHWFVREPLYKSLNLFDLTPSPWVAVIVAAIAIGGVLLLLDREGAKSLLPVGIGLVLIPLSFLPNLVVKEDSPTYRVQISLSSLIVLYVCLGAIGIWLTIRDWAQPRVSGRILALAQRSALALAVAFVGASAVIAAKNVTTLVVEPQSTELRLIRSRVAALPAQVARIGYVQIAWNQGLKTGFPYSDELGIASSARPWTAEPAVHLILREEGRLPPEGQRPVVDLLPWYTTTYPENEPVIDMRILQRLR